MKIETTTIDAFRRRIEAFTEENAITIGAPAIGKTYLFAESESITHVRSLAEAVEAVEEEADPVVIDDFYLCHREYQETDADDPQRTAFEVLLDRETGVCLATRPYSFEYILETYDILDNHGWLDTAVYAISYDEHAARRYCTEIDPQVSLDKVDAHLDHLLYQFESETLDWSYETYIPTLALSMVDEHLETGIFQRGVDAALARIKQDGELSSFINTTLSGIESGSAVMRRITNRIEESIPGDRSIVDSLPLNDVLVTGSAAVAGAGLSYIGLPIVLAMLLNEDDSETIVDERLGTILGGELLPPAQERLERELGLEPMTLASLQAFTRPGTIQRIRQEIEANNESIDELAMKIEEIDPIIESLSALDEEISFEEVSYFFSTSLQQAVQPVETITEDIRRYQIAELIDKAGYEPEEVEQIVEGLHEVAIREPTIIGEGTLSELQDELVPVRGPAGIGKSSHMGQIAADLRSRAVATGMVRTTTPEILETRLRSLAASNEQVALFVEYRPQQLPPDRFRELFGEILHEYWDILFVEVNDSEYASFSRVWGEIQGAQEIRAATRLEPSSGNEVRVQPLESVETIPRQLGISETSTLKLVETVADGNPLVAFEASIQVLIDGPESIGGLSRNNLLAKRFEGVMSGFERIAPSGVEPRLIMELLAAAYAVVEDDDDEHCLETLVNLTNAQDTERTRSFIEDEMASYILIEDDRCRLQPSIYRLLVFEELWFGTTHLSRQTIRPATCRERFVERYPNGLIGIVLNIAELCWPETTADESSEHIDAVMDVVEIATRTPVLDICLYRAGENGLGLPLLELPAQSIAQWQERYVDTSQKEERLFRAIGRVAAANQPLTRTAVEEWGEYATSIHESISTPRNEYWANMTAVHSFIAMGLVESTDEPTELFDFVTEQVRETAQTTNQLWDTISNYFSLALWPAIRDDYPPEAFKGWFDVLEAQVATLFDQPVRERVYVGTYALLLSRFAPPSPGEIDNWVEAVERRLTKRADIEETVDPYAGLDLWNERLVYLRQFYARILSNVGEQYPEQFEVTRHWIRFALSRLRRQIEEVESTEIRETNRRRTNHERSVIHLIWFAVRYINRHEGLEEWLLVLLDEAESYAEEHRFQSRSVGDLYAMPIAAGIATSDVEQVPRWLDLVIDSYRESSAGLGDMQFAEPDPRFELCILTAGALMKQVVVSPDHQRLVEQIQREATPDTDPIPHFYSITLIGIAHMDGPQNIEGWLPWIADEHEVLTQAIQYLNTGDGLDDEIADEWSPAIREAFSTQIPTVLTEFLVAMTRTYDWNEVNEDWLRSTIETVANHYNQQTVAATLAAVGVRLSQDGHFSERKIWVGEFAKLLEEMDDETKGRYYLILYLLISVGFDSTFKRDDPDHPASTRLAWLIRAVLVHEESLEHMMRFGEQIDSRETMYRILEDAKEIWLEKVLMHRADWADKVKRLLAKREGEVPEYSDERR